jgi:hypothetical protein
MNISAKNDFRTTTTNKINALLLKDDRVSINESGSTTTIKIGDVEFIVSVSWADRYTRSKSYVILYVKEYYTECKLINFNRNNKVEINKAIKNINFVFEKAEALALELTKTKKGLIIAKEKKESDIEIVKNIFISKGYEVSSISINKDNGYDNFCVYTTDIIFKVSLNSDGKVMVKSKTYKDYKGVVLELS